MKSRCNAPGPLAGGLILMLLWGLGASLPARADSDKFLCAEGLQGGSADKDFQGCSEVHAYSQSLVSRELDPLSGGSGKQYECGEASLVKRIDAASPLILVNVLRDVVMPSISIHFRSKDAVPVVFLTIELKEVTINSVTNSEFSPGAGASALPIDMETLGLAAKVVRFTFTPPGTDGSPGTPVGAEIDCATQMATPF